MLNKKSKKSSILKYLMVIPTVVVLLLFSTTSTLQAQVNSQLSEDELKEKIYQEIKKKHETNDDFTFFVKEATIVMAKSKEHPLSKDEFYIGGAYLRLMMEKAPREDNYQKQKNDEVLEALKNSKTYEQYLESFNDKDSKTVTATKSNIKFELPPVDINKDDAIPFAEIDQAPTFEACDNNKTKDCFMSELQNFIRVNFNYPQEAMDKNIQGKVYCNLIINKKGEVQILDLRAPDPILEKSVYELLMKLPKLKPAIHKGKPTKMAFSLPISYKLAE